MYNMLVEPFAEWINEKFLEWEKAQGKRRRSYSEFARWLGVSQPSLSKWLNGDNPPTGDNLRLLAEQLGGEIYTLLGKEIPPEIQELDQLRGLTPEERAELDRARQEFTRKWLRDRGLERDE